MLDVSSSFATFHRRETGSSRIYGGVVTSRVRVFVSFDRDHDRDLCKRLVEESQRTDSQFQVAACSTGGSAAREEIGEADEMIVVCGAQSDASAQMHTEITLAQDLDKPYFLLWGRRDAMCKRPLGSRPDDAMYGWSPSIIHSQVRLTLRGVKPIEVPEHCKKDAGRAARAR